MRKRDTLDMIEAERTIKDGYFYLFGYRFELSEKLSPRVAKPHFVAYTNARGANTSRGRKRKPL